MYNIVGFDFRTLVIRIYLEYYTYVDLHSTHSEDRGLLVTMARGVINTLTSSSVLTIYMVDSPTSSGSESLLLLSAGNLVGHFCVTASYYGYVLIPRFVHSLLHTSIQHISIAYRKLTAHPGHCPHSSLQINL